MTLRVVVTGPECAGKTTLAAHLAERHGAPWLEEAARSYAAERASQGHTLTAADVEPIARRHIATEAALFSSFSLPPSPVFLDTDLLSTVAYARHYYGASSPWLEAEARGRLGDLYLFCAPDIPWTADGIRDRPDNREEMFALFAGVLEEFGANVQIVRGLDDARTGAAEHAVSAFLDARRIAPTRAQAGR